MKRKLVIIVVCIMALVLSACGSIKFPNMTGSVIAFTVGDYTDGQDTYAAIEYNGRTYVPYGTQGKALHTGDIDQCIGYMIQNGQADTEERIYTLTADPACNFLVEYYASSDNTMDSPSFWRAIDTKGQNIVMPDFIDDLGYACWH